VEIPDDVAIREVGIAELPAEWRHQPAPPELRDIGTVWAESGEGAVLQVPSAVVPGEHNFLLNPRHPDFGRLGIGDPEPFAFDERLVGPST
jgi:RES domain-containing protein